MKGLEALNCLYNMLCISMKGKQGTNAEWWFNDIEKELKALELIRKCRKVNHIHPLTYYIRPIGWREKNIGSEKEWKDFEEVFDDE